MNRPRHQGMYVPYIASWSAEHAAIRSHYGEDGYDDALASVSLVPTTAGLIVSYHPDDPYFTEVDGVLWNDPPEIEAGEPMFAEVHTRRHRRCVMERRCQVCAGEIGDGPLTWQTATTMPITTSEGEEWGMVTMDAPTCARCFKLSIRQCPFLRVGAATPGANERRVYNVRSWRPFGAMCQIKLSGKPSNRVIKSFEELLALPPLLRRCYVAEQAMSIFTDYERIA